MKRDFIHTTDLSSTELQEMLDLPVRLKSEYQSGGNSSLLQGKVLGMIFQKPNLRTRVSFDMAMRHLGGDALYLSPNEIGLGKRESIADIARVMSGYVHAIMARVFDHAHVVELARWSSIPVINGLSHVATFALGYALYELWRSWGIDPDVVAGYDVGEYVAAYAAGVSSVETALRLIAERARLTQELGFDGLAAAVLAYCDEVIIVDGHSTDGSPERLKALGVAVIQDGGLGKGDAIRRGLSVASGDVIVTMDADGSHDPADIRLLVAPIDAGEADLVIGCRMRGGSDEFAGTWTMFVRLWGNNFLTQVINTRFGAPPTDT